MTFDEAAFAVGAHHRLHDWLGAHEDPQGGYRFAVWAPRARQVRTIGSWDGLITMRRSGAGIWRGRAAAARPGDTFHYEVQSARGKPVVKADPFARQMADPSGATAVLGSAPHRWRDGRWMQQRGARQTPEAPLSVYEVHLGSWQRDERGEFLGYREIGRRLAAYATEQGFTHVELLPVAEHPFYGSWGYQGTAFFAPTSRYGSPSDFKHLVDSLHRAGVGVILDWVPSHFATDEYALGRFDGYPLFEHRDPKRGFHPDWQSHIFDYGKGEVRSFLLSNARFWLDEFHIDGLRVDAVASMLYLDFSRKDGEWNPNEHGGNENLEAYGFLRDLNAMVTGEFPGVLTIAEESSAWPGVTRPNHLGGLGFDLKWDMGWMHDTLHHFRRDPDSRPAHHSELTFRMMYAHTERFMLAFSHDEVVYEKASMIAKMPGTDPERFANLRVLYGYQWAMPGKKLLFMGGEFAQWTEWNHDGQLEWDLLRWKPHRGIRRWITDLNRLLREHPALTASDFDPAGFDWIAVDDNERGVIAFRRHADPFDDVVFVANLSLKRHRRYRLGVPRAGRWQTLLNSDAARYGGAGRSLGSLSTTPRKTPGFDQSLVLDLPPLTAVFLAPVTRRPTKP